MIFDKNKIVDGIVFVDEDNPYETITFNYYSWVEIIKGIIVKYAGKSKEEAEELFFSSFVFKNLKIKNSNSLICYSHDTPYHWAMLITYGHQYWILKGISSQEPNGFLKWEKEYRKKYNLAKESFSFSN